jgi:uncharacterized membrane protein
MASPRRRNGWLRSWRAVRVRPRLVASTLAALAVFALLPALLPAHWAGNAVTHALIAWNFGTVLYMVLALTMMARATPGQLRRRAQVEDEGRWAVLALVSLAVLASLVAIALQLGAAKDLQGARRGWHVGLAALTVVTSWAFMQVMFALHYAHEFHTPGQGAAGAAGGMEFPGTPSPDYLDFVYAAAIIGTSAQTADVTFTSSAMRRTALLHSVLAFFFNTTVLALAINIAAGLL